MTTESYKNGATTLSRMNFSGQSVGHVTVFLLNVLHRVQFSSTNTVTCAYKLSHKTLNLILTPILTLTVPLNSTQ